MKAETPTATSTSTVAVVSPTPVSEEEIKSNIVQAWLNSPRCMETAPESKTGRPLPAEKATTRALHAFLKQSFTHVAFEHVLEELLAQAPLLVWQTWNVYMAVAASTAGESRYAENVLELARAFVRATDPTTTSPKLLARFQTVARTRDSWPGSTAKAGWIRDAEMRKLIPLRLSGKHRSMGAQGHIASMQLDARAQTASKSLSAALQDAPPLVQRTRANYLQLASSDAEKHGHADLLLSLACEFVDAADPSKASPELREHFKRLAEDTLDWPGWLTRPLNAAREHQKLDLIPLGKAFGLAKTEAKPKAPALVAQHLLACLRQISEMRFHGDQCVERCNVTECLNLPCRARKCPWQGKPPRVRVVRSPRFFWDFHEFSRTKPPLNSDPIHAEIWLAVAGRILDCEHGSTEIRAEARAQHFREFNDNPTAILDPQSPFGFRIGEPRPPSDHECFGKNLGQNSAFKIIPTQASGRNTFLADGYPFALAYSHVQAYCRTALDIGVKSDSAKYRQFRKDVLARLRARLPKPPARPRDKEERSSP